MSSWRARPFDTHAITPGHTSGWACSREDERAVNRRRNARADRPCPGSRPALDEGSGKVLEGTIQVSVGEMHDRRTVRSPPHVSVATPEDVRSLEVEADPPSAAMADAIDLRLFK